MTVSQSDLISLVVRLFSSDINLMSDLAGVEPRISNASPLAISDLSGAPLFLDYDIIDADENYLGYARSFSKDDSYPLIDSISLGARPFDISTSKQKAVESAQKRRPGGNLTADPTFVCYGYPRTGVLVRLDWQNRKLNLVFDAPTGTFIREWETDLSTEAGDDVIEGEPFYSYLSLVPEAGTSPGSYIHNQRLFYMNQFSTIGTENFTEIEPRQEKVRIAQSGATLPIHMSPQETPVFCAVATAQMMLGYLGLDVTQTNIAEKMKTATQGTTNENFVIGWNALTESKWKASIINSPSFDDFVKGISDLLPIKSGIPQHARLARGWREYTYIATDGSVLHRDRFYVIDDPWPINKGQLVLENVDKVIPDFYRNLIKIEKSQ